MVEFYIEVTFVLVFEQQSKKEARKKGPLMLNMRE
jgi:hypothetical protein